MDFNVNYFESIHGMNYQNLASTLSSKVWISMGDKVNSMVDDSEPFFWLADRSTSSTSSTSNVVNKSFKLQIIQINITGGIWSKWIG